MQNNDATPEPEKWYIRLFGSLQTQNPTHLTTEFPGTKSGALLGFLAYNLDKTYSREVLAEMFWPDGDPVNQRTRLRQELSALRALLNAESPENDCVLITTNKTVQLSARHVTTDVRQFLDNLDRASSADSGERERLLEQAVDQYRGELLKDYPEQLGFERSLCSHRHEQALRDLATLLREKEDLRAAKERLEQLIGYNPLLEEAHVDLMRLYAAVGQPASIRRQYQTLEKALHEQLGTTPSIGTQQEFQELMRSSRPTEAAPVMQTLPVHAEPENGSRSANGYSPLQDLSAAPPAAADHGQRSRPTSSHQLYTRILVAVCFALTGILCYILFFIGIYVPSERSGIKCWVERADENTVLVTYSWKPALFRRAIGKIENYSVAGGHSEDPKVDEDISSARKEFPGNSSQTVIYHRTPGERFTATITVNGTSVYASVPPVTKRVTLWFTWVEMWNDLMQPRGPNDQSFEIDKIHSPGIYWTLHGKFKGYIDVKMCSDARQIHLSEPGGPVANIDDYDLIAFKDKIYSDNPPHLDYTFSDLAVKVEGRKILLSFSAKNVPITKTCQGITRIKIPVIAVKRDK